MNSVFSNTNPLSTNRKSKILLGNSSPFTRGMSLKVRPIAFYSPQYYPNYESEGMVTPSSEWRKIAKALPLFKHHYQPHIPLDLGFYDLRVSHVRAKQAELAKNYGIYGFCYYHFWFNGKPMLEKPFDEVLNSSKPDLPFCICWSNENWTGKLSGSSHQADLVHNYNFDDDKNHIRYLFRAFEDDRYIKVDGKPVFLIYRTELFPDINRTAEIWREETYKHGLKGLYLIKVESYTSIDPRHIGFDAAIEFQPDWRNLPSPVYGSLPAKVLSKLKIRRSPYVDHKIISYSSLMDKMLQKEIGTYKLYRGITPMWDNSARRNKEALILHGSKPEYYEKWLKNIVKGFKPYSPEEDFIFINGWNGWAEGNHLEPCEKWGKAYLEATLNALKNA